MKSKYEIQKRRFTSNIIEKVSNINGKTKREVYLAPLVNKKEGDTLCDKLILFLNKKHDKT